MTGEAVEGVRWSPDATRLVYAGVSNGKKQLFIVDVASGRKRLVPIDTGEELGNPSWSSDGRDLVFTSTSPEGPRLMRLRLGSSERPTAISGPGWLEALDTGHGLFAVSRDQPGIWRLTPGRAPELIFADFHPPLDHSVLISERDWAIANDRIYVMDRSSHVGHTLILSRPIAGGAPTRVVTIDRDLQGSLAVNPVTNVLVYRVPIDDQYDIAIISFSRR